MNLVNKEPTREEVQSAKSASVKIWMEKHHDFVISMDIEAFEVAKGTYGVGTKFNSDFVKGMLKEAKLRPEFSAGALLKEWKRREL